MSLFESIISGIIQGVTEFLPVSSSGHLVLLHDYFGFKEANMIFDVFLHLATLFAVVIYFYKDILAIFKNRDIKFLVLISIATLPAVLAGVLFESRISSFFGNTHRIGYMFFITAFMLLLAESALRFKKDNFREMNIHRAVFVGLAQALALIPGISRSGATISSGLLCGISKQKAFNFSFLLSIPVILGAVIYKLLTSDLDAVLYGNVKIYTSGMLAAFISGIICLKVLWWFLKTSRLYIFSIYCVLLGIIALIMT